MSTRDLRELATAADMSPPFELALVWTSEYGSGYALETPEHYLPVICGTEDDAVFIAAANPQRVLALLDALADLEAKARALLDAMTRFGPDDSGQLWDAAQALRALVGDETPRTGEGA